ncbi:hypothetical protein DBR06_SOUSAS8010306, partial [Sousa chinensis]
SLGPSVPKLSPGVSGVSLGVQGVGLHAPNAGDPGLIPGRGATSRMPQLRSPHAATKDTQATT